MDDMGISQNCQRGTQNKPRNRHHSMHGALDLQILATGSHKTSEGSKPRHLENHRFQQMESLQPFKKGTPNPLWLIFTVRHGKIHHAIKNGKPSISIRAIYTMAMLVITRGYFLNPKIFHLEAGQHLLHCAEGGPTWDFEKRSAGEEKCRF